MKGFHLHFVIIFTCILVPLEPRKQHFLEVTAAFLAKVLVAQPHHFDSLRAPSAAVDRHYMSDEAILNLVAELSDKG